MPMKSPVLKQQFFELRYNQGYRYLDRCGDTMILIENALGGSTGKEWMPENMRPQGAVIKCPELEITVNIDTSRLNVTQAEIFDGDFVSICDELFAIIKPRFKINEFVRIGYRRIFIIGTDDIEDARKMALDMAPFTKWPMAPEGKVPYSAEVTSIFESQENSDGIKFSIYSSFTAGATQQLDERLKTEPRLLPIGQRDALLTQQRLRRKRESDPAAGMAIDMDSYQLWPDDVNVKQYIMNASSEQDELKKRLLEGSQ